MANPSFESMFKVYPCLNAELRTIVKLFYKFGKQIAQEPSAALTAGLDEHAIRRQEEFLDNAERVVEAVHSAPRPDWVKTHPTNYAIDLTEQYRMFVDAPNGLSVALNDHTRLLAEYWMIAAVELATSQSANQAGSLYDKDYERAKNNLGALRRVLDNIKANPQQLDLAELAVQGAELGTPVTSGVKKP